MEFTKLLERQDIPSDIRESIKKGLEEIKKIELENIESKSQYETILNGIEDPIHIVDREFRIMYFNDTLKQWIESLGFSTEIIGQILFDTFPFLSSKIKWEYQTVFSDEKIHITKEKQEVKGKTYFTETRKIPIIENGLVTKIVTIISNITEHTQTERALEESEKKYRTLVEKLEEGLTLEDVNGNITFVNPKTLEQLGYTEEELLGKHWTFIVPEKDHAESYVESNNRPKGISSTYESNILAKDGTRIPVIVSATPIFSTGKFQGTLVLSTDITELKEAEKLHRSLVETARDIIFTASPDGKLTSVNPTTERLLGWTQKELIGMNIIQVIHPDDIAPAVSAFRGILKSEAIPTIELRLITKSGQIKVFSIKATPLIMNGETTAVLGIARDITVRKEAERAREESEQKFRTLVTKSLQGLVITQGSPPRLVFVNQRLAEILGYSLEGLMSFVGKDLEILIHPEDREMFFGRYQKRLEGEDVPNRYEVRGVKKTGEIRWLEVYSSQIEYLGKPAIQAAFVDITARKRAEQKIQQIKLEEERYHVMAGHFVNNDLQKIVNNMDLLLLRHEASHELDKESVQKILDIASRSSKTIDLVNKIFGVLQTEFSQQAERKKVLDIIDAALERLKPLSSPGIIEINKASLSDIEIMSDIYLEDIFYELMLFIIELNYSTMNSHNAKLPVVIEGTLLTSSFCVIIRDTYSQPISQDISEKILTSITENWEYQGHYLPIALASVVLAHYSGKLEINPLEPKGNEFRLHFPLRLVIPISKLVP
jgi:PAS domain S-box-containing protein